MDFRTSLSPVAAVSGSEIHPINPILLAATHMIKKTKIGVAVMRYQVLKLLKAPALIAGSLGRE